MTAQGSGPSSATERGASAMLDAALIEGVRGPLSFDLDHAIGDVTKTLFDAAEQASVDGQHAVAAELGRMRRRLEWFIEGLT